MPGQRRQDADEQGSPRKFVTTRWSKVLAADCSGEASDYLCNTYWVPLYYYEFTQPRDHSDAEDKVQGFFEFAIGTKLFAKADPARGRFRSFLVKSYENFVRVMHRKERAAKRGGASGQVSLDHDTVREWVEHHLADGATPEMVLDLQWALQIQRRAQDRMQQEWPASLYDYLSPVIYGEKGELKYAEVGRRLGRSEGAIMQAVHRMKRRYHEVLRQETAQTQPQVSAANPAVIDEDLHYALTLLQGYAAPAGPGESSRP